MIKNLNFSTGHVDYSFAYVSKNEIHGGVDYNVNLDHRLIDDLVWLRKHRERLDREAKARNENPALQNSYDQYQTMLKLVLDQI